MQAEPNPRPADFPRPRPGPVPGRARHALGIAVGASVVMLGAAGWAATRSGPAVTPDSVQYLSAAWHVATGSGVRSSITDLAEPARDVPFTAWPPLFPVLLGGIMRLGASPFAASRWLNLALLAAAVFPLAAAARRAGGSGAAAWTVGIHAVLFYPVMLSAFVWSEPLYIALSLTSLALAGVGLEGRRGAAWAYAGAGALAGAAMLARYVGFTLIAATAAGLWLLELHRPPRVLGRNLAAYLLPAALPNAAWLWRNRALTGSFFGPDRPAAWFGWDRILGDTLHTLAVDATGPVGRLGAPWATALAAGGAVGALLVAGVLAGRLRHLRSRSPRGDGGLALLLWVYAAAFLAAMIVLSRRVGFDALNTRYLAPVYPVLLLLAVLAARALLAADRRRSAGRARENLIATALVLLALPQLAATSVLVAHAGREERALTAPYWTSTAWDDRAWDGDPAAVRLRALAGPRGLVISNVWDVVGIRTGAATKPLPEPWWDGYPARLLDFPGAVIAVDGALRTYRAGAEDLDRAAGETGRLEPAGTAGDWTFYRVLPAPAEAGR